METNLTVRNAKLSDAPRILEIYTYYVENTVITFEYDVPSLEEFENRMIDIMKKYPYLVIERDGRIEGYAYAHASSAAPPTTGPVSSRSIWITMQRNAGLAENSMKLWLSGSKTWEF